MSSLYSCNSVLRLSLAILSNRPHAMLLFYLQDSGDNNTEWLSIYLEDCLSTHPVSAEQASQGAVKQKLPPPSSSNARRKKRSLASVIRDEEEHCFTVFVEPPLLLPDQKHWLAESELILPKKDKDQELVQQQEQEHEEEKKRNASAEMLFQQEQMLVCSYCLSNQTPQWWDGPSGVLCNACGLRLQAGNEFSSMERCGQEISKEQEQGKRQEKRRIKRPAYIDEELPQKKRTKKTTYVNEELPPEEPVQRCTHCMSHKTPQWRTGPLGPKTLCNACGVRYKSGRLLPEYRPANSPTFSSYMHSNSHKKVMQMRKSVEHSGQ